VTSEVWLKSELSQPLSGSTRWLVGVLLIVCAILMFFGVEQWYFAKVVSWWLALPAGVLGIFPGMLLYRATKQAPPHITRMRGRGGPWILLVFMPCLVGAGIAVGAPSLWLRLQGADREVTADVITVERRGSRGCNHRLLVVRYVHREQASFCIDEDTFFLLRKQKEVVINTREGFFGTLAFAIRPAESGPE